MVEITYLIGPNRHPASLKKKKKEKKKKKKTTTKNKQTKKTTTLVWCCLEKNIAKVADALRSTSVQLLNTCEARI